jgi:hypothetical protein
MPHPSRRYSESNRYTRYSYVAMSSSCSVKSVQRGCSGKKSIQSGVHSRFILKGTKSPPITGLSKLFHQQISRRRVSGRKMLGRDHKMGDRIDCCEDSVVAPCSRRGGFGGQCACRTLAGCPSDPTHTFCHHFTVANRFSSFHSEKEAPKRMLSNMNRELLAHHSIVSPATQIRSFAKVFTQDGTLAFFQLQRCASHVRREV